MAVYVDDMRAPFRNMIMCHMIADSTEELLEMADKIGVARKWLQYPGTHREHFDIALSKRALAVKHGAVEITWKETGEKINARRKQSRPCRARICGDTTVCVVCNLQWDTNDIDPPKCNRVAGSSG